MNKEYIKQQYANIEKCQKIIENFTHYIIMANTLMNHSIESIKKELEKENTDGSKK